MKLSQELINTTMLYDTAYNSVFNAHGLYNTEQFVLRLSQKNHSLIDQISDKDFDQNNLDDSTIQAYSTYLHETIHWWQHVGSTTGLVLSFCYPLQTHSNLSNIKEWCDLGEATKSIKKSAMEGELSGNTHLDPRQALANAIVNNTMDFEFFKKSILHPKKRPEIYKDPYFESQGHCFHIVYANFLNEISSLIDPDSSFLNYSNWEGEFDKLRTENIEGYYYGSELIQRDVGVFEIFEGQACFSQMHFLASTRGSNCELEYFKDAGMLHGVYESAFNQYISLSKLDFPKSILDPIVGLFLLICDLSINPSEGFPCKINSFSTFVNDADPAIRFETLCLSIPKLDNDIGTAIKQYSKQEYMNVSSILLTECGFQHPSDAWESIQEWLNNSPELKLLMKEQESFKYSSGNTVIKVLLSHYIAFTLDKRDHPEFFCWPGHWKTSGNNFETTRALWLKHLSIFTDKENDDGIFIRQFTGKKTEDLLNTLNNFFGHNFIYDLSRQWVLKDGDFSFDFRWLSEDIKETEWNELGNDLFKKQYGISITDIISK